MVHAAAVKTVHVETDVRPGGASYIVMQDRMAHKCQTVAFISKLSQTEDCLHRCLHLGVGAFRQAVFHLQRDL